MRTRAWLPLLLLLAVSAIGVALPERLATRPGGPINPADVAWMLTATGLVLLMTPGLSFFYGGMVDRRNVISTMLQSFMAMAVISIVWVVCGFSLAFGESFGGLVGDPRTFFMLGGVGIETHPDLSPTIPLVLFALFQLKFAIITPALITGSFAERVRFSSYLLFMTLFSILIYGPLAHWTWHPQGVFRVWGVLDFAGGTVVHLSAGFAALAGAMVLGRRHVHREQGRQVPANIPFVLLGTGMLWFGWFGFNAGSALAANGQAAMAFATTNTASAAAAVAWMAFDVVRGRRPSAIGSCVGAVVGLVAITPAAGYVSIGASIMIGTLASIVSNSVVHLKSQSTLDDTLDVFACHGVGGIVGMIATGIFAREVGLLAGSSRMFLLQLAALVIAGTYAFVGSWLLYKLTDAIIPMRVPEEHERVGLDLSQHGESIGVADELVTV
jgi:Amt family ammonium transporter